MLILGVPEAQSVEKIQDQINSELEAGNIASCLETLLTYMVRPGLQEQFVEMEEVATAIYPTCLRGFFALWP